MDRVRFWFEPVITPVFRAWWRLSRSMTLGVRTLVTDDAGRVLLIRHTYKGGWFLPGGGVERGQTADAAARRELAEEAGIEAIGPLVLVGFYANHASFPNDHVALYRVTEWRPCAPRENGEIAERGFFALDALPGDVSSGTRRRIAEVFEGAPPSAEW